MRGVRFRPGGGFNTDGREGQMKERRIIRMSWTEAALALSVGLCIGALLIWAVISYSGGYPSRTLDSAKKYRDTDRKWSEYQLRRLEKITVVEINPSQKDK
jgi:hypothetical protein